MISERKGGKVLLKVLNLYAGIGGNRKLWEDVEVTAVEMNPKIAAIYQDFFPDDKMIVADAHQYLLKHFSEYDFIWSSPPCPSHSRFRAGFSVSAGSKIIYPDMQLYEEILLLKRFFNGKYCIENVISYYKPLIRPSEIHRHYFWSNFFISDIKLPNDGIRPTIQGREHLNETNNEQVKRLAKQYGYNVDTIKKHKTSSIKTLLRNCVNPHLGLHILNESKRDIQPELFR